MKTTNKILLASILGIVLILVGMLVAARSMLGSFTEMPHSSFEPAGEREEQSYAVSGFTGIELDGAFDAAIEQGDSYEVRIEGDRAALDLLDVSVQGDVLVVAPERSVAFQRANVRLFLTLPELRSVRLDGGTRLTLSGLTGEELQIESNGAAHVRASGGRFGRLELQSDGAGRFNFEETPVEAADVLLDGVGSVTLQMAGGVLSGEINGAGSIEYGGTVADERVSVNGFGSVERR